MNGWKTSFFVALIFGFFILALQQFSIADLKSENDDLKKRIEDEDVIPLVRLHLILCNTL